MAAYDEILDFLTSAPTLEQIVSFTHSDSTIERLEYLTSADEGGTLTDEERVELREFNRAEGFMEQLKIRARRRLHQER